MKDLYLEAMMHGEAPDSKKEKQTKEVKEAKETDNVDSALDKLLDEYIDTNFKEDEQNPLTPKHLQRAKMKEELKADAHLPELTTSLETAFKILMDDGNKQYVDSNNYE